ncbi:unnamed protein product, partial [marine sediment metagenome]
MTEQTHLKKMNNDKTIPSVLLFFILTYVITWGWALMIIYLFSNIYQLRGYDSFIGILCTIFVGIQSFGPAFAAIIIIAYYEGKKGLKRFAKRLIKFKVKYYWYLLVFFMPIVVYSIPILIDLIAGNPSNYNYLDVSSWGITLSVIVTNIVFAGLAEEPGWRGFAVPALNKKFRPIVSGIIIGVIWAFWHLMQYIYGGRPWETFPQFVFTVTVISCIYVWIYLKTESIPLMII